MTEVLDRPTTTKKTKSTYEIGKAGANVAAKIIADEIKKRANAELSISIENVNATDNIENLIRSSAMLTASDIERIGDLIKQIEAKRISNPIPQLPPTAIEERAAQEKRLTEIFGAKSKSGKKSARCSTSINPSRRLQNNEQKTSDNPSRQEEAMRLAEITRRFNAGEPLLTLILDVCSDVAEIVGGQAKKKKSLIGELSHSHKFSKKIDATFGTLYGVKHNHSPELTETISTENMGTFAIKIKKVGETEKNREIVEKMLNNPELRPVAYAKRPAINGKKPSLEQFFNDTYGAFRDSNSIYLHEIKILDKGLYTYLGSAGKHITSTMKKCTDQVTADLALLAKVSKRAHNVLKSSYGR